VEREMLSYWQEHCDLFPKIPSQSRFNRRRRGLMQAYNLIRQVVLRSLDVAQDRPCVIDSLPLPALQFYLVPNSRADWKAYGATIFGYKLHRLTALNGILLDFVLAPANQYDLAVGFELLSEHHDLQGLGDKADISVEKTAQLWQDNRIRLQTIPRRNQRKQLAPPIRQLFKAVRQMIETVNPQLSNQFHIEVNHVHTFWGLCTRLYTKLAAHTLCIYLNRLLGKPDFLQIKALAFPI